MRRRSFYRGGRIARWRHVSLALVLDACLAADPSLWRRPEVRNGLREMEALQEASGGYRNSRDGFVTTYTTAAAIGVLVRLQHAVDVDVTPVDLLDLHAYYAGASKHDPQKLIAVRARQVIMNSDATALLAATTTTGCGLGAFAVAVEGWARRLAVMSLVFLVATCWTPYLQTLGPPPSRARIAALSFAAVTAVIVPLVTLFL